MFNGFEAAVAFSAEMLVIQFELVLSLFSSHKISAEDSVLYITKKAFYNILSMSLQQKAISIAYTVFLWQGLTLKCSLLS